MQEGAVNVPVTVKTRKKIINLENQYFLWAHQIAKVKGNYVNQFLKRIDRTQNCVTFDKAWKKEEITIQLSKKKFKKIIITGKPGPTYQFGIAGAPDKMGVHLN